jgi:hypothetical protein
MPLKRYVIFDVQFLIMLKIFSNVKDSTRSRWAMNSAKNPLIII